MQLKQFNENQIEAIEMGQQYGLKCKSCDYSVSIREGIGMAYSPDAVFPKNYPLLTEGGFPSKYWMTGHRGEPYLFDLVRSKPILEKAIVMLCNGADIGDYGHSLYDCPKCHRLSDRFHFELRLDGEAYEPNHKCLRCRTLLKRAELDVDDNDMIRIVYVDGSDANWRCPSCSNDKLEFNGPDILWD